MRRSPLRPATTDLRMFVLVPYRSGYLRVARVVGVKAPRKQLGRPWTDEKTVLVVRCWKQGKAAWDKTLSEVLDTVESARLEDFLRVGLIIRDENGVWL